MTTNPKDRRIQVRVGEGVEQEIATVARKMAMSDATTARVALSFGLAVMRRNLGMLEPPAHPDQFQDDDD